MALETPYVPPTDPNVEEEWTTERGKVQRKIGDVIELSSLELF